MERLEEYIYSHHPGTTLDDYTMWETGFWPLHEIYPEAIGLIPDALHDIIWKIMRQCLIFLFIT